VFSAHPVWGHLPHDGYAGTAFFGLAPDRALEIEAATAWLRRRLAGMDVGPLDPVLLRLDSRSMAAHAYLAECRIGAGRLLATTLRIGSSIGTQPSSLAANVGGQRLLEGLLHAAGVGQPSEGPTPGVNRGQPAGQP